MLSFEGIAILVWFGAAILKGLDEQVLEAKDMTPGEIDVPISRVVKPVLPKSLNFKTINSIPKLLMVMWYIFDSGDLNPVVHVLFSDQWTFWGNLGLLGFYQFIWIVIQLFTTDLDVYLLTYIVYYALAYIFENVDIYTIYYTFVIKDVVEWVLGFAVLDGAFGWAVSADNYQGGYNL